MKRNPGKEEDVTQQIDLSSNQTIIERLFSEALKSCRLPVIRAIIYGFDPLPNSSEEQLKKSRADLNKKYQRAYLEHWIMEVQVHLIVNIVDLGVESNNDKLSHLNRYLFENGDAVHTHSIYSKLMDFYNQVIGGQHEMIWPPEKGAAFTESEKVALKN